MWNKGSDWSIHLDLEQSRIVLMLSIWLHSMPAIFCFAFACVDCECSFTVVEEFVESYWSTVHTLWTDSMALWAQRMEWEDNVTGNYEYTSRYVDNGGMLYFHCDVNKEDKKSIQELPKKCALSVPLWRRYTLPYNEVYWLAGINTITCLMFFCCKYLKGGFQ